MGPLSIELHAIPRKYFLLCTSSFSTFCADAGSGKLLILHLNSRSYLQFSMLNSQILNACLPQDTFESEVNFTEGTIKVERGPESISSSVMSH